MTVTTIARADFMALIASKQGLVIPAAVTFGEGDITINDDFYQSILAAPESDAAQTADLTKAQFKYLTYVTGLEDAIDAVLSSLKASDLIVYAATKSALDKTTYNFEALMALLATPNIASRIPSGVDVSEETLAASWANALQQ